MQFSLADSESADINTATIVSSSKIIKSKDQRRRLARYMFLRIINGGVTISNEIDAATVANCRSFIRLVFESHIEGLYEPAGR